MRRLRPERQRQYEAATYLTILERIAANILRLRLSRGWTQEEAAERCDAMTPRTFQTIEAAGSNVTATTLARLADGLGVDPSTLLAEATMPPRAGPGRPRKTPVEPDASVPPRAPRATTSRASPPPRPRRAR